jgi:cytochrome c-type biogenesis protein CcmF
MHLFAYSTLLVSMLLCLTLGIIACAQRWHGRDTLLVWMERGHLVQTLLLTLGSLVLFAALAKNDFSFKYVAEYTDVFLPLFYRLTAFWAGQAGSLLFWAWTVAIFGAIFVLTPAYQQLRTPTKVYYWMFFYFFMAFFLLLLTNWSNPFVRLSPPPPDGNGLNPLLQHPGMIFHPPLLFLGYAGFTIPACLALAQALSESTPQEPSWMDVTRNFTLASWLFLTAGIILGAWWAYMELGWGGYWAWDPVENASLIPWFAASAFLHTSVLQRRRGCLNKINVLLMTLTLIMCFFATYLVRSGVVDSLHAFSGHGVGTPLLLFILLSLFLAGLVYFIGFEGQEPSRPLSGLMSREGFLVMTAWLLLTLGAVVLLGTMWPVFSQMWSPNPVGLEASFYNRVCLPFFAVLTVFLLICPWLEWKGGLRKKNAFFLVLGAFAAACVVLLIMGVTLPVALLAAAAALGCVAGIVTLFVVEPGYRKLRTTWGAYGVHFGLVLVVLGVAISGPYEQNIEAQIKPGDTVRIMDYTVTYVDMREGTTPAMAYVEVELLVEKDGKPMGTLKPQRRQYRKFSSQFAEAEVLDDHMYLGNELYATLLGTSASKEVAVKISVHPLVNWIWIGGTLMCLFPFLGMRGLSRKLSGKQRNAKA